MMAAYIFIAVSALMGAFATLADRQRRWSVRWLSCAVILLTAALGGIQQYRHMQEIDSHAEALEDGLVVIVELLKEHIGSDTSDPSAVPGLENVQLRLENVQMLLRPHWRKQ
jgi:biotin transporter BioY